MIESFHKRYTQTQLTDIFANISGIHPSKLSYLIWNNPKDPHSLRLSISGYHHVVTKCDCKPYTFDVNPPLTNKNLLQFERYFQGMYFIVRDKLVVFDEDEASMINLMGGDVRTYLNNLESNFKQD